MELGAREEWVSGTKLAQKNVACPKKLAQKWHNLLPKPFKRKRQEIGFYSQLAVFSGLFSGRDD